MLKAQDEVLEDYVHTAKSLDNRLMWSRFKRASWIIFLGTSLQVALGYFHDYWGDSFDNWAENTLNSSLICAIGSLIPIIAIIFVVVLWVRNPALERQNIEEIAETMPEFAEFYKAYKRDKSIQLLKVATAIALSAAVGMVIDDLRRDSEASRIQSAVNDELRRHGL